MMTAEQIRAFANDAGSIFLQQGMPAQPLAMALSTFKVQVASMFLIAEVAESNLRLIQLLEEIQRDLRDIETGLNPL
jgi:hypothetical protein